MTYNTDFNILKKPVVYLTSISSSTWVSGSYFAFSSGNGNMTNVSVSEDKYTITLPGGRYMFEAYPSVDAGLSTDTVAEFSWEINGEDKGIAGRFNDYQNYSDRDIALAQTVEDSDFTLKLKITNDVNSSKIVSEYGHAVIWSEHEL